MTKIITYSLRNNQNNSNTFYNDLGQLTDNIIKKAYGQLGEYVDSFCQFLKKNSSGPIRTHDEYLLELIMAGIFLRNYAGTAVKANYLSKKILKYLYLLRNKSPGLKPFADKWRGFLAYLLLAKKRTETLEHYSLQNFRLLLDWMDATGEFKEEVIRLRLWEHYLGAETQEKAGQLLSDSVNFSVIFTVTGKHYLGRYTEGVVSFWKTNASRYRYKEDYFLTGRKENEYFVNMFGAEILNRQLQPEFRNTPAKAVLLPTCMRNIPQEQCKAKTDGKELVCMQCSPECNIGQIAKAMKKHAVTSYLITHSSDFSKFLIKWKDDKSTGLVGVACVLNLLTGGYEMKRMGIPSQCVFLDYCGCKKHWDTQGIPTSLNRERLDDIITGCC
jgi:uncharacterized protein